jgi:aerobic carbon-monoxide dehydrogenase large subunit
MVQALGTEQSALTGPLVGRPMARKEDFRLLTGTAQFLEDLRPPSMLHAKILRSPFPHAKIVRLDLSKAASMDGVHDVISGPDLLGRVQFWGHQTQGLPSGERFPFAFDKVMYEGQEVAAVVADNEYIARDALEAIEVEYDELPAIVDLERAIQIDAPTVMHSQAPEYTFRQGNAYSHYVARVGDIGSSESAAEAVVRGRFVTARPHGAALENHGCLASYETLTGRLTIWSSTQSVYLLRDLLAEVLGLPMTRIRAMAVEVGAGFGSKADLFPHEVIASVFALRLGRPVRLILSRDESFRTGARCNQVRDSELHVTSDGKISGWRERILHNAGAGSMWSNQILPLGTHIGLSCYPIPNVHIDGYAIHTNTVPGGALRGFGVPQTMWAVEQLVDMAAEQLNMDPLELRMRNVFRDEECPKRTPLGHIIDSTAITECMIAVAEATNWSRHRADPVENEGIGLAICMKHTSCRHPAVDTDLDSARIRVETDGFVTVYASNVPHGQGHSTMLSQIAADAIGVSFERVRVVSSDTDSSVFGLGTWGARSAAVLGAAVEQAGNAVRQKILAIAAHLLECAVDDLEIDRDEIRIHGYAKASLTVADVSVAAGYHTHELPEGVAAGSIEATSTYDTPTEMMTEQGTGNISVTYSGTAHIARVRVTPETGEWRIVDYAMASDSGVVVNPLIVEGQHQGAFLHGFGWVMGEGLAFDEGGHLTNSSFASYLAPYATELPNLSKIISRPAPSRVVPGGRKGAGESATAVAAPAIANAITHATGVRFTRMPLTPDVVYAALEAKRRRRAARLVWPD